MPSSRLFSPGAADSAALHVSRLVFAGLSPRAPGTAGSALAAALAPWLFLPLQPSVRMVLLVILYAVGSWAAGRTERLLGSKDPSCVVVDELVGQWIALFPLCAPAFSSIMPVFPGPALGPTHVPLIPLAAGFVLFRVFDISKPGAVRKSESWLKGGQGIMIDDVLAGVMALAALCGFCLLWSLAA